MTINMGTGTDPQQRADTATNESGYYAPTGGHPPQTELLTDRAMFTEAYAVLPRGVMRDIVTSYLPFWDDTRLWVIARPLSGFAETFSQYIVEVAPGGGSERPELDPGAEGVLFVVEGEAQLTVDDDRHALGPGGYAYLPPGQRWTLRNDGPQPLRFHWIRKAYEAVVGLEYLRSLSRTSARSSRSPCRARTTVGSLRDSSTPPTYVTTCTSISSPLNPVR